MSQDHNPVVKFLLSRRSRPAKTLLAPPPSRQDLETILEAAARTPDHGKLEPWRFIVFDQTALTRLADQVEQHAQSLALGEDVVEKAVRPFKTGPLAVAVIEVQKSSEKVPSIEQSYSAGAACLALLNTALAMGYGANWISGWISHDRVFVEQALKLTPEEQVAGFIYIGTESTRPPERPRPNLNDIVTWA